MRPIVVATFALTAAFAAFGCSSEIESAAGPTEGSTAAAASATSLCETYCEKFSSCDTSVDVQTCTAWCEGEIGSSVAKLRADVVAAANHCFATSDCKKVLDSEQLAECFAEAEVTATPSERARAFCDAYESSAETCDSNVTFNRAKCLSLVTPYSDETLEKGMSCTTKPCDKIAACIEATF